MENKFEEASRKKLRFDGLKGTFSVEDLWDLKLDDLDKLAKSLNKQVKESEEESFIKTRKASDKVLDLKFEIVKHVIKVKLEEQEAKELAAARKARKEQILELIEKKQMAAFEGKSIEELKAELEQL